jgi:hypothetical protein
MTSPRKPGYLLLALEDGFLVLLYLLFVFVVAAPPFLGWLYTPFVEMPLGAALVFATFCVAGFRRQRQIRARANVDPNLKRVSSLALLVLLFSAIATVWQSVSLSPVLQTADLTTVARWAFVLNLSAVALSLASVLTVWSLYWALGTSPIEELGALTPILLAGGLVAVWAVAGRLEGADYLTNVFLVASVGTAFALDLYVLVLACGLLMGKRLRMMVVRWRWFVALVAAAALVTISQERLGYEITRGLASLAGETGVLLKLEALQSFLWMVVATLWALAVLVMDPTCLTKEQVVD